MKQSDTAVLVVENERAAREFLAEWCHASGYTVAATENTQSALMQLNYRRWNIMFVECDLLGAEGAEFIQRVHEIDRNVKIIVVVALGSLDHAVSALKAGAFDYISKPIDREYLGHVLDNALAQQRLTTENERLRDSVGELLAEVEIFGSTLELSRLTDMIDEVSNNDIPVMIRGERGTGKMLIARALHARSRRRYFPFVTVWCDIPSRSLLERELFGDESGGSADGRQVEKGRLEIADGGSLFLSGVGKMDPKNQMQLLHTLETRQFTRVGGGDVIRSDFRVICATDENLEAAIKQGAFREDLFACLNAFTINLPPLRTRPEDIPNIAHHFLQKSCQVLNKQVKNFSPDAIDALKSYRWPGNVRELENVIERAVLMAEGPDIGKDDLALFTKPASLSTARTLKDIERIHVEAVLKETGWNVSRSADILGIDRVTLYNKMARYGLKRPS